MVIELFKRSGEVDLVASLYAVVELIRFRQLEYGISQMEKRKLNYGDMNM